ncbi:MAG: type secretion system domain, type pilus assembly protein PilC [Candidatus Kaiserbacteria bacterium]|nr:type secretion system domain, type pilus assembly protein PilC [Candidatus Kaiserbacteria bacterium]
MLRLSNKQQVVLFKRIAMMLRAGIPLGEVLKMIGFSESSKNTKYIITTLLHEVQHGIRFSQALQKFPKVFIPLTINLVKIGEESGSLHQSLIYVSDELKKRAELRNTVIAALIYPIIIILATMCISLFLAVYLFPKLTPIFKSVHTVLPLSTRILIGVSDFLIHDWYIAIFGAVVCLVVFGMCIRVPFFRHLFERILFRVPIIGGLLQSYELSLIARTGSALLLSGIQAAAVLKLISTTTGSAQYRHVISFIAVGVEEGSTVADALSHHPRLFPSMFVHIIHSGEMTGRLQESFGYISENYEQEVKEMTKNLTTLIEPLLMLVMGSIVEFIALSIITPIYQLTQSISNH